MITSRIYNDLPVYCDNLGHPRGSYVEDDSGERRSLASLFVHLVVIITIVFINSDFDFQGNFLIFSTKIWFPNFVTPIRISILLPSIKL